jgi:hypothetical protein
MMLEVEESNGLVFAFWKQHLLFYADGLNRFTDILMEGVIL